MIQGPLTRGADQWKVYELLLDFSWDWGQIPFELPFKIKSLIQAILIPIMSRGQDRLAWSSNPKGTFDLKSAYSLATAEEASHPFSSSWIWKLDTLPKIRTFLWRCQHNSIGVKSCLARRGWILMSYAQSVKGNPNQSFMPLEIVLGLREFGCS